MKTVRKLVSAKAASLNKPRDAKTIISQPRAGTSPRRSVKTDEPVTQKSLAKAAQRKKLAQRKPILGTDRTERREKASHVASTGNPVSFNAKTAQTLKLSGEKQDMDRSERPRSISRSNDSEHGAKKNGKNHKYTSAIAKFRKSRRSAEKEQVRSNKHVAINTTGTDTSSIKSASNTLTQKHAHSETVNANLATSQALPPFIALRSDLDRARASHGFCDRLAITLDHPEGFDRETLIMAARDMAATLAEGFSLKPCQVKTRSRYRHSYKLTDQSGRQMALFQFFALSTKTKAARLEMNPKKLGPEGLRVVKQVLKALLGPTFIECIAGGNITRVDASCDISQIRPSDLVIWSNRARSSGIWVRYFDANGRDRWEVETLAIGARESDYYLQVYDKSAQLWNTKNILLKNLKTRIEARMQPRNSQRKSAKVSELRMISNPFLPINVAYFPEAGNEKDHLELLFYASQVIGQEAVLKKLGAAEKTKRAAFRNMMSRDTPDWWQPERLWQEVLEHLHSTGLFPDRTFQGVPDAK